MLGHGSPLRAAPTGRDDDKKKSEAIALTRPFIDPKTSSRRRGTKLLPFLFFC